MKYQTLSGETPLKKPDGGYCSISTQTIGVLWWCYAEGLVSLRAVRVGLALFEVRIRRAAEAWRLKKQGARPEFVPAYSAKELGDYCGLPEKRARAALKELLDLGLVAEFSPEEIRFARSLAELTLTAEQGAAFRAWHLAFTKRRRVPVGRRILALACESSSPALIAVILGASTRCSWLKPEGFSFSGRISCGWLAGRFRLSLRAVQSAKQHLVGLGWLERKGTITRFGEAVAINPAWHRLASLPEAERAGGDEPPRPEARGTNSAGVRPPSGTNPAGLSLTRESLPSEEIKYQRESRPDRPEAHPGPGIFHQDSQKEFKNQDRSATPPPPRLSSIRPEDFADVGRALELFRQAVKCRLMDGSEHSRLRWLAAIERARTVPARNPAGVFLHLVKGRHWDYLSDGHFEAANDRLKAHLFGRPPGVPPLLVPRPLGSLPERDEPEAARKSRPLSRDALLIQVVRNEFARKGHRGDVFHALRAHAGFTRERYEAALVELGEARPLAADAV